MIAYDLAQDKIVQEVVLPSELVILSAYWSPNMEHIAATVGHQEDDLEFFGDGVCIFSETGELLGCQEFSILQVRYGFSSGPAPIKWSQDSRHVFAAAKIPPTEVSDSTVQIAVFDIEQMTISFQSRLSVRPANFITWEWAVDTGYAVITVVGKEEAEAHLIRLTSPFEDNLLATSVWLPTWSLDQHSIAYMISQDAGSALRVAHIDRDGSITTDDLVILGSISVPFALSWSSNSHQIAIVSPIFDENINSLRAGIIVTPKVKTTNGAK